jgi:hypothetical protein
MGVLVVSWASTPTYHHSCGCGGTCQRLVIVVGLVVVVAAALSGGSCIGLVILACLRGKCGVSCAALCSPSTLVCQAEKLRDILDVMHGKLLRHLIISHTLVKCNHNRRIGDTRDGVANLRETLDEGTQSPSGVAVWHGGQSHCPVESMHSQSWSSIGDTALARM